MANRSNAKLRLTIEQKFEAVQHLETGLSVNEVATAFKVNPSTIRRIKLNAAALGQLAKKGDYIRKRKTMRKPTYEDLEIRLYAWFLKRRAIGEPMMDSMLLKKAIELNKETAGPSTFKVSRGWLWRFKKRHGIRTANASDEKDADIAAAQNFAKSFAERIRKERILYENIYNMDDTGLAWKALPTKSLMDSDETSSREKTLKKDRVTIGLCTNATGNHKLKPLFINKFERGVLWHFKNRLPVSLKAQHRALMDQSVFVDWYQNNFKPEVRKYQSKTGIRGKVFLLLYDRQEHKLFRNSLEDNDFEIVYLSQDISPLVQPMDQGIVDKTKTSFRHRMLQRAVTSPGGVKNFYSHYSIRGCIDLLSKAWEEVNSFSITTAWKKIIKNIPQSAVDEEPRDPIEFSFQDLVTIMNGESASEEDVDRYLLLCNEAEANVKEEEEKEIREMSPMSSSSDSSLDEEQAVQMFGDLKKWSRNKPDLVQLYVDYLIDYGRQK